MIDERRAVKLALAWDAEGPVGALAALSELAPDLSKLSYKPFHLASLAAATLRGKSTFEVKNASVKAAVNLIENCEEKWGPADWAYDLCQRAVVGRLQLKDDARVAEAIFRCAIPAGEATAVVKFLRPVVEPRGGAKTTKGPAAESDVAASSPPWYVEVKRLAEVEKEKADKEAAEAKRLAEEVAKAAADADAQKTNLMGGAGVMGDDPCGAAALNVDCSVQGEKLAVVTPAGDTAEASQRAEMVRVLKVGDTVGANAPRKPEYHGYTAKLKGSLTWHCWVEFLEGPLKGGKHVKVTKDQIVAVESSAAPLSASSGESPNAQPPMNGEGASPEIGGTVEADGGKGEVDWQSITASLW